MRQPIVHPPRYWCSSYRKPLVMRRFLHTSLRRGFQRSHPSQGSTTTVNSPVQITTLQNKLRVATESTPSHFSSVGLYIDAGSRYETPSTSGVSHFLDRMAFKVRWPLLAPYHVTNLSTQSTSALSDNEMAAAMSTLGGQILCSSSRETIMYQSSHFHRSTPLALSLISDTIQHPNFLPEELEMQRDESTRT